MPQYEYEHPVTKQRITITQGINDKHEYFDEGKVKWNRIFSVPNAAVDTKWDANDSRQFVEKTGKMKGTYGDMLDKSAELSEERASKNGGIDPLKQKRFDDYKNRTGKRHFYDKPKNVDTPLGKVSFED